MIVVVAIISIFHLWGLIGGMLSNGLSVFNTQKNDQGIMNFLILLSLIIAIFYIISLFRNKKGIKLINHTYWGMLLLAYLTPYLTYFLHLPSNDYARIGGIILIPTISIAWIWSNRYFDRSSPSIG